MRLNLRLQLGLLLAVLLFGAALPAVESVPPQDAPETVETFPGPVSGERYTVYRDPTTDEKWIAGPYGVRYASATDVMNAEYSRLGDTLSRMDGALRESLDDPQAAAVPVPVSLILREQPLRVVAASLKPALRRDLAERDGRAARERIRQFRQEVLARSAPLCAASRAPVIARLGAVEVDGTNDVLNCLWVTLAPDELPAVLRANPEIWLATIVRTLHGVTDVSTPSTGVSSWWTKGYTGSGVAVGILDSGLDNQHPYIKNSITQEKVELTYGKNASGFKDDATKTDDLHGHGTHVGSTAASYDSTYAGVAKGASLVNAKCFYKDSGGRTSADERDVLAATAWAAQYADVFNCSFGASGSNGSSQLALLYDAVSESLGLPVAVAAGNSGSSSGTVLTPGDAFNVITVGASDDKNSTSPSDDTLASYSSRGPTSDGRRKPDLTAPGHAILAANHAWEGATADFKSLNGTSMATPHVAGAVAVLLEYDSTLTPQAIKSLLLNTVRNTSPYPASPDDDWGYGGMDLATAYPYRASVKEQTLTSSGDTSVFYVGPSALASGNRTTLTWFRQVTYSTSNWPGTPPSLTDLDLHLYDGSTGTAHASSTSTVNSVEQVKTTSSVANPVVRVALSGSLPTGVSTQDFAVATPSGFKRADPPQLSSTFGAIPSPVGPSTSVSVTVTVSNDGDLRAFAPKLTMTVPFGFSVIPASGVQTLPAIAAGGTTTTTFLVTTPATSQTASLKAKAETTSYGETFVGSEATGSITVDADAPSGIVKIAAGDTFTGSSLVTLALTVKNPSGDLDRMRFSNDDSSWSAWESFSATKSWTLATGDGARTVYAQFADLTGNLSAKVSDSIVVDTTAPTGGVTVNSGAAYSRSSTVSLSLAATDGSSGVEETRLRNSGGSWSPWEPYSTSKSFALASGEGMRTVEVQFRDLVLNESQVYSDAIVVDPTAPTGSITIDSGATYATVPAVTLTIAATDATSGVYEMRFSNDGATWTSWLPFATSRFWVLEFGDGSKTVHAQFRDIAGNESGKVTARIELDTAGPSGRVIIDEDLPATNTRDIALAISGDDANSGVDAMSLSDDGMSFSSWEPFAATRAWTLPAGEGEKTVFIRLRDRAGNVSAAQSDSILLDQTSPTGSFRVNDDALYILPAEDLSFEVDARDEAGGVRDFRVSFDGGANWSNWYGLGAGSKVVVARPSAAGPLSARIVIRDIAGNESAESVTALHLIPAAPRSLVPGAKFAGALGSETEIDTISVDLAKGDLLTITLKGKGSAKKTTLDLSVDVALLSGGRLITDRWPAGEKKASVKKFPAPATGTYLVTIRRAATSTAPSGTYKLTTKVKQAAGNRKLKGDAAGGSVRFDAVGGSTLKGTLEAEGLTVAALRLVGPSGEVPFTAKEKKGKVTISAVLPSAGTGTYELRTEGGGPLSYKLSVKLPKKPKGTVAE